MLHVARDISVFLSAAGPDRAGDVIEQRAGGAYDPHLAALATDHLDELLEGLDDALIWEQRGRRRARPQRWMTGDEIDAAFGVIGTFTDLKSYWLRGHAEGTSQLAEVAAWRLGLPEDEVTMVRRAALALDLGRVAVSNAILGISAKTAGHHVQHIFDKAGVRTRSAATVWAFERHVVQAASEIVFPILMVDRAWRRARHACQRTAPTGTDPSRSAVTILLIGWSSDPCPCPRYDFRSAPCVRCRAGIPGFRAGRLGLRGTQVSVANAHRPTDGFAGDAASRAVTEPVAIAQR